eukprot:CAMPEP_0181358436 /NCGR_PEP_ID=MMETSP1106-20121128/5510_1 /TAXON_ID=81844 /ORGANISM="Mantoniella antarctica, Strain SL-175" /LENGTH=191 /DNA_ID=CAMNT_0023471399 /DNA_START=52 /DNA_END=627 /DNA_ORIENTATION=-
MAATASSLRVIAPLAARPTARTTSAARTSAAVKPARVLRGGSVRAQASESEVSDRLEDALKVAAECVDECAAMWDEVEELSQAASDKKPSPDELEPVPISESDMNFIRDTQAALAKAKEAGLVDVEMLRSIEAAAASVKQVSISSERLASLERALDAALSAAKECTGDNCAVEWEAVEEISDAKAKLSGTD